MRGRRFGRPVAKKRVARENRELRETATFFAESAPVDFNQVCSVTLNSLEHLGNQRFPLPPYSEHFQRWMKDVKALMSDFQANLPELIEQQFKNSVEQEISEIERVLQERARTENDLSTKLSGIQQQLNAYENARSKLDSDYKTSTHEIRRRYEQDFEKIRSEIGTLDAQRLTILHRKPSLLRKLFHRPETNLEENASSLRSKKTALTQSREALTRDLEGHRTEYESKRKQIADQISHLRAGLEESNESGVDDALDLRKTVCDDLRREVEDALSQILKQQDMGNVEDQSNYP